MLVLHENKDKFNVFPFNPLSSFFENTLQILNTRKSPQSMLIAQEVENLFKSSLNSVNTAAVFYEISQTPTG